MLIPPLRIDYTLDAKKRPPKGRSSERGERGRHHSGKAMQGNVPRTEHKERRRDRRKRVNFKDLVPLLVSWLMHFSFHNSLVIIGLRRDAAKPIVTNKILVCTAPVYSWLQAEYAPGSGIWVQILGAQVLILGILFFDCLELIQQRLVTDLEDPCRLSAIPSRQR